MKWFRRLFGLGSGEAEKAVEPICVELDQAVTADDAGQVARLLDGGVSPNALVSERNCALGLAALLGHCDCARVLLERGALVDGPAGLLATPLQAAASGLGGLEMVQSLVEHGANLMPNNAQGPVLLCAAEGGDPEVVRYLLDRGAPYAPTDYDPATPLERAVEMSNADAALLLAEVDTTWPALHRAALQGDETKARDLLNRGGNEIGRAHV